MKEYIEREAARDLMEQAIADDWEIQYADDRLDEIPAADVVTWEQLKKAWDIATTDVAEVRHGWWISVAADVLFRCSLCDCEVSTSWDYDQDGMFDYCPCCGAKMDGGVNDGAQV